MKKTNKIVINSSILYVRMIATMMITLYISRVVVNSLGIEQFGLYSVLSSFVIMAGFVTNILAVANQRFLSESLSNSTIIAPHDMFKGCFTVTCILAFVVFFIIEITGIWFIDNKLVQHVVDASTVHIAFQFSVAVFIINILYTPFLALLLAHEKMSLYAWLTLLDVLLKLLAALLINFSGWEPLISYTFNLGVVSLFSFVFGTVFILKKHPYYSVRLTRNRSFIYKIFSYIAWNLWGGIASVMNNQGVNILLNIYFGVAINASRAIASQVYSAINQVVSSCGLAFNPQLVKSYIDNDREYSLLLITRGTKLSAFLTSLVFLIVYDNVDVILNVWIGKHDNYTVSFIQLMLIDVYINCLSGLIIMAIQATGRIRLYQTVVGGILLFNLPVSFLFLTNGFDPIYVYIVSISISLISLSVRLCFYKHLFELPVFDFCLNIIFKFTCILLLALYIQRTVKINVYDFISLILSSVFSGILLVILTFLIGLNKNERVILAGLFSKLRKKI